MKNNFLPAFAVLVLLLVISGPVPIGAQTSLTDVNTASLFGNDIDMFMDPNDYGEVEFDNFFASLQHDSFFSSGFTPLNTGTVFLTGGFAKYFGEIYTGFYFIGDLFQFQKTSVPDEKYSQTYNMVQALIGSPSFGGIKFGFSMQGTWQDTPVVKSDAQIYTVLAGWGNNFELGNGTMLKPEANAFYVLPSSGGSASFPGLPPLGVGITLNYIFGLSLETDWVLVPKENIERSWSFGYALALLRVEAGSDYNIFVHTIHASYKQVHSLTEQFSAAFNCGIEIDAFSFKQSFGGTSFKMSDFTFTPVAAAGFIYSFNSPFSVNAGLSLGYPMSRQTLTGTSSTTRWPGFEVETTAGGSFEPNPSLAIDFSWSPKSTNPSIPGNYYNEDVNNVLTLAVRIKR